MLICTIADFAELEALRPEWMALQEACTDATPFQSPEWLLAWWQTFHPGTLASLAVRDDGRLIALAPFYVGDDRILRFIGSGTTDYLDILAAPGHEESAGCAILAHIARGGKAWDRSDLFELRGCSPLLTNATAQISPCSVCPVVSLPVQAGKSLRRNLKRYQARLEERGTTEYETVTDCRYQESLEALFRLHTEAWAAREGPGVLAGDEIRCFHRAVARGFAARGWLRLFTMRHRGAIAAVIYAFAHRRRAYFYLGGFAPELAGVSPGTLLFGHAFEQCARAGLTEGDLLRGEEPYKYMWGARNRTNYRIGIPAAC